MSLCLWLSRLLLLATVAESSVGTLYDLELDTFWSNKAPAEEAFQFFKDIDKYDDLPAAPYGVAQEEDASRRTLRRGRKKNITKGAHVRSSDDGDSIDKGLEEIKEGLTLNTLTNSMFNGNNFQWDGEDPEEEDGKMVVKASFRDSAISIPIPGGDLMFKEAEDKDALVVKVSSSEATFEKAIITMEGEAYFNQLESYTIEIKIEKEEDSEDFKITEFKFADKAMEILEMIGGGTARLEEYFDVDLKSEWINKLKEELGTLSGFGAFNKESLQIVLHLDDTSTITSQMGAKSVQLLIAQSGAKTPRRLSVFVTIEELIQKIGTILGQSDVIKENFLLKNLNSEACIFLVNAQMEYLDSIKGDERLATCFGDQELEKAAEAFKVVDAGLHVHVKIDFKDAIAQGCYDSEEPPDLENEATDVSIYGKITKQGGLECQMLTPLSVPTKVILQCFKGMFQNATPSLTAGTVTIKEISRYKITEDDKEEIHWKLGVLITPGEEYKTIPGTQISLENLELDAEGNQGDASSWDIDAKLETSIGRESKIDISLKKCGDEYFLELKSSKLILSDVLSAFSATPTNDVDSKSILDTLGVKDFTLSMKFGDAVQEHEFLINGKPIIFGFDKLEIAAIIAKPNPNAPEDSRKKKNAVATRRSSGGGGLKVTVGLYLNGADFTAVMKNVFGREDINMQWLSGLKAIAVFTNDAENVVLKSNDVEEEEKSDDSDDSDGKGEGDSAKLTKLKKEKKSKKSKKSKKRKSKLSQRHSKKKQKKRVATKLAKHVKKPKLTQALQKTNAGRRREPEDSGDEEEEATDDEGKRELTFDELHESLVDKSIDYTITFAVMWTIPADVEECAGNSLCTWMSDNMKGMTLCIMGELGGGVFKLTAAIEANVELIKDEKQELTFDSMKLTLEVGLTVPSIEIEAQMTYSNTEISATGKNALVFKGTISASVGTLSLTFSMANFIFPTFGGVSYFAIGDIILGGGVTNGLPNFVFGAALKLGKFPKTTDGSAPKTDHAIEIRGAFGIDLGNPKDSWVFGSINALTVKKVCEAFKLDCSSVPEALKDTGFPYGITASYSAEEREVETVGTIPQGLYVKGTLNIFGFEVYCELQVSADEFFMHIEMSPLDWGNGMIQVLRSKTDKENGPIAKAKFSEEEFSFFISGYANVLSILEAGVCIKITDTTFEFKIEGYIIPAFLHVTVHMYANYGGDASGDDPLFKFRAVVSAGFSDTLKKAVLDFMNALKEKVDKAFGKAQESLDAAQKKVQAASDTVESWKATIGAWKKSLEDRKKELDAEMAPPPCNCPKVCFQFFDWDSHCWKIWGYWVGCPYWNSCFKMIDDIFCLAGCAISKVITTLVKWAKQAILSLGQLIAGGVEGLLTLAQGVLSLANGVLEAAKKVVELARRVINGALQLAADAFKKLLESFALKKLELTASLTADYSACVGYEYDLIFFGKPQQGSGEACLDLKGLTGALIGSTTENEPQTKGVTKTPERLTEVDSECREVAEADKDFESEKGEAQSKVTEDTNQKFDKPEGRGHIPTLQRWSRMLENVPRHARAPTKQEMEITKLATQKIPRYNPKTDPKVRRFTHKSPWNLPHHHRPVGHNRTVRYDESQTGEKRSLDFGSNITPCTRMKRALQGYSDLTDGILKYSQAVQTSHQNMERSKVADTEKLSQFHDYIEEQAVKHNMTDTDREDAYYVYSNLADRHAELEKKSKIAFHAEDSYAMPIIRRQINGLLEKEKGTNFVKFTELMHANAVEGYKRSQIPNPALVQGEKTLAFIKAELQSIVTNDDSALTPMTSRLVNVKRSIVGMSEMTKKCRDN